MSTRYRVLSVQDIKRRPPMQWVVKGILPAASFTMLYGPAGVGKSFVALDLAHHIGLGDSWFGHETTGSTVMYVAASEGGYGLKYRIKAWESYNETRIENVAYGLDAVQLHDETSVRGFLRAMTDVEPRLIIFDTLARCAVGQNENSVEGVGPVIQGVDRIRAETKAAVLLVHHTGKPDEEGHVSYRGSSAFEGAADTMIEVGREQGSKTRLQLSCYKQKDAREFLPIRFRLTPVDTSAVPTPR